MPDFVYNEETRKHTLNGKHIASVSQVIEPLTDFSGIPEDVLARKTELGKEFHEAIRLHLLNDLHFDSIDPDLIKPMETYIQWWPTIENVEGSVFSEVAFVHEKLLFCGKPDRVTNVAVWDFKLRPYNRITDTLQLESYKKMVIRDFVFKKPLKKRVASFGLDGKIKIVDAHDKFAWGIFRRLLERYYSELEFNNLMEGWKGLN